MKLQTISKKSPFQCFQSVVIESKNLVYCLENKEWKKKCPVNCSFYQEGSPVFFKTLKQWKIEFECQYFIRDFKLKSFLCTITRTKKPICYSCFYLLYQRIKSMESDISHLNQS